MKYHFSPFLTKTEYFQTTKILKQLLSKTASTTNSLIKEQTNSEWLYAFANRPARICDESVVFSREASYLRDRETQAGAARAELFQKANAYVKAESFTWFPGKETEITYYLKTQGWGMEIKFSW